MFKLRLEPKAWLTPDTASYILERAVIAARETGAQQAAIRPATFCAVLRANPAIVEWIKDRDGRHTPHFRTYNGQAWPLDLSEELYPARLGPSKGRSQEGGQKDAL